MTRYSVFLRVKPDYCHQLPSPARLPQGRVQKQRRAKGNSGGCRTGTYV
jgi:hypothetical protein